MEIHGIVWDPENKLAVRAVDRRLGPLKMAFLESRLPGGAPEVISRIRQERQFGEHRVIWAWGREQRYSRVDKGLGGAA